MQGGGLIGENNTYSGEGVLSGIYKNVSFSLGAFHYETDGWRTRAFQDDTIANAFLQFALPQVQAFKLNIGIGTSKEAISNKDFSRRIFPKIQTFQTNLTLSV